MTSLLIQLILAQRNPDDDGWMNILAVIVMAVIWMVGAIVKSAKTKASDDRQSSQLPSRKPPLQSRGGRQQTPAHTSRRPAGPAQLPDQSPDTPTKKRTTLADLRAAAQKFAAEAEQAFQDQTRPPRLPRPTAKSEMQPSTLSQTERVVAPAKTLATEQATASAMPSVHDLSDLMADYADPEKLKRAILHYEILGLPLSLRG